MKTSRLFITLTLLCFLTPRTGMAQATDTATKLFSFGVVADIQYADVPQAGRRNYRGSLKQLEHCVEIFNRHPLSFVISLGDIIDRDYESFKKPELILSALKVHRYNVLGNHEFSVADSLKKSIRPRLLNSKKGYYAFVKNGFKFIVLDGSDESVLAYVKGTKKYRAGMAKFEAIKNSGQNNAYLWNGGIGKKQYKWLKRALAGAEKKNQQVILFCHWPLLPENGTQLWDNRKLLQLLNSYTCVKAYIAGHHHAGSYVKEGNIHYLTLKGMVESTAETSCGIISVYANRLEFTGYGDQENRVLLF